MIRPPFKIAFVHEWLTTFAGSEKVLEQMLGCFPHADLFTMVDFLPSGSRKFLGDRRVRTSFVQRLPFAKTKYRAYLPFMPLAVEQFDVSGYDVVISSSHAVAKGIITGPDQLHICMCYSPIRYAWDLQHQYLRESKLESGPKAWLARIMLHRLRIWDVRTSNGVDKFIAISGFIAKRIRKVYRRESVVIYPPVDIDAFLPVARKDDFYLTASRMVPYKRMDLIVAAFASLPTRKLVVIGDGPDYEKIKAGATANVTLLGFQDHAVLQDHMQRAKAFIFAAEEDFGIAPLEAQACGTPVIAYGRGGAAETIRGAVAGSPTGLFFYEQSAKAIADAVTAFEALPVAIEPADCRRNAERFSIARFVEEFTAFVHLEWKAFNVASRQPTMSGLGESQPNTAPEPT